MRQGLLLGEREGSGYDGNGRIVLKKSALLRV
jgi:hypothetical protein